MFLHFVFFGLCGCTCITMSEIYFLHRNLDCRVSTFAVYLPDTLSKIKIIFQGRVFYLNKISLI